MVPVEKRDEVCFAAYRASLYLTQSCDQRSGWITCTLEQHSSLLATACLAQSDHRECFVNLSFDRAKFAGLALGASPPPPNSWTHGLRADCFSDAVLRTGESCVTPAKRVSFSLARPAGPK